MNHMSSVLLHCSIFDIRPSPPPTSNTQGEINGRILSLHLQSTTNISTPKHIGRKRNRQAIFAPHFHVSFPEMSPAFIDSGAQSQALQTQAHLSSPLISSQFLPDDQSSAFVSMNRSDGVNPNFQFSAASMSKPVVTDNPAFRPVPALSRPRMAKTRKSQHGRPMVAPEPRKSDAAFNRIRPISDYYKPPPSSSGMYPGESVLLGGDRNVDQGNDLESSILDEIKNLRLLDDQGAGVDASSSSKHFNVTGDSQTNIGFGRGDDDGSGHSSLLAGIPNDLKKLNINDPVVTPLNHISFGPQGNRHFEFGHREKESRSVASSMADTITNRMRNLVVEASHNANEETKLSHGREAFGGESHSMILDDLGKLKLGEELKESDCYYEGLSSVKTKAPQHRADYGTQSKHQFVFTSKLDSSGTPYGEVNTPNTKGTSSLARPWGGTNIFPNESSFEDKPEPSESYSPMEVSPYQEICPDNQSFRDISSTSEGSVHVEESLTSNNHQPAYGDILDEELISATEHLGINEARNMNFDEGADQVSVCSFNGSLGAQASSEDSVSAVETESFKSATDLSEISEQSEEISSRLNDEVSTRDSKGQFFSASSSELKGEIPFTFSASIIDQVAPATRNQKKKIRPKVGHDPYSSLKDTVLSDASSTIHFSSVSRGSSPFNTRSEDISAYHHRKGPSVGVEKAQLVKQETPCPSATAFAAKEACEKWRLRGNQAYTNGELDKAEDCYTQGVNCISKGEASRDGLRALMLCYSNRAAIRMALQKFRDALTDCRAAAEIDPNFFKVHIRTANCYLAMGEVAEASSLLMKLLQSGTEACMDRKFMLEASESIEKAQKVTRCIDHSVQLLRHKTLSNAKDSMQTIDEGLTISPYSEKLLHLKVEALFMMQRYQEVIELCEQTLQTAEKNSPLLVSENQSSNLEPSEVLNKYSFLIWRYSFIFNSYYCLGKLEEGLDFLDKRSELRSIQDRCGTQAVESLIPLLVRARELLKHKSAGNAAYQGGRHAEAVEHYTAALSCSAESRPFAAICFGNRAAAYQALGQIPDAIADCNLAIALDRNYLKAISRRATLFEMIRDYEEASNDVQRIVSLLTKEAEENVNRPVNFQTDLRQAHMRLAYVEEQASKGPLLDFYVILGVEPSSATSADLKKAYRKAALRHHPDKACQLLTRGENVDDGLWKEMCEEVQKEADRLFKMIGEAYSVLSDPTKRSRYEEEVRNNLKRTGGTGGSRMRSEGQSFSYQRNSSGRTAWRSPGSPNQRFEPSTRSSRFH